MAPTAATACRWARSPTCSRTTTTSGTPSTWTAAAPRRWPSKIPTHVRKLVNVPAENPPGMEASNFAVYSDAVDPVTTATIDPPPNANGWNRGAVSVTLEATDLASGLNDTPAGWVDQLRYTLAGAQTGVETVVPGHTASFGVAPAGVTTVSYSATDAAGNEEAVRTLDVKIDGAPPVLSGLPAEECTLWPANHKLRRVAVLRASDDVS